jgi:excisionase family DNA binding protein
MLDREIYENEIPSLMRSNGDKLGKWLMVEDAAEMLEVSKRTIFEYLKDGKISGIKSRGRRLISTGSVLVYMLKIKVIEINDIKHKEIAQNTLNQMRVSNSNLKQ